MQNFYSAFPVQAPVSQEKQMALIVLPRNSLINTFTSSMLSFCQNIRNSAKCYTLNLSVKCERFSVHAGLLAWQRAVTWSCLAAAGVRYLLVLPAVGHEDVVLHLHAEVQPGEGVTQPHPE